MYSSCKQKEFLVTLYGLYMWWMSTVSLSQKSSTQLCTSIQIIAFVLVQYGRILHGRVFLRVRRTSQNTSSLYSYVKCVPQSHFSMQLTGYLDSYRCRRQCYGKLLFTRPCHKMKTTLCLSLASRARAEASVLIPYCHQPVHLVHFQQHDSQQLRSLMNIHMLLSIVQYPYTQGYTPCVWVPYNTFVLCYIHCTVPQYMYEIAIIQVQQEYTVNTHSSRLHIPVCSSWKGVE